MDLNIIVLYRIDEPIEVRMQVGNKEIEATMLNLSAGGMALLTDHNIPVWTTLAIKFTLSKMDKQGEVIFYGPMEIIGEVRSNVLVSQNEYRLGIRFTQINLEDKTEIVNFVKMALV